MSKHGETLVYAQIGDLHLTTEFDKNFQDLQAIAAELEGFGDALDFVFLPGDIAENGRVSQFALADVALAARKLAPLRAITGDHDVEQGTLAAFHAGLSFARDLPFAETFKGVRCLFLDLCGAGLGGLDFRLPTRQRDWLEREIAAHERCAVFMHTYPIDLTDVGERLATIKCLASPHVLHVGIGHTHYNELSNDGDKIYAATRSTGQIEEAAGVPGYAVATIDGTAVSWRFREIGRRGPVVLVTSPVDRRLATSHTPLVATSTELRVTVLASRGIAECRFSIDGAAPRAFSGNGPHYRETLDLTHARAIAVTATDVDGHTETETVELTRAQDLKRFRHADGSDADRLDRWVERGIIGTQLGPNRNGHGW